MDLTQATVLVTGTSRGIGRAYVRALLAAGTRKIYATARNRLTVTDLEAIGGGRIFAYEIDVTDPGMINEAAADCGDVSILINNAGYNSNTGLISAHDLNDAHIEINTNYFGMLKMCRAFAPVLARNGGGIIVNMLSITAHSCIPLMGSLSASKAAAWRMTQGVRAELAAQGTRVMGIFPGAVDTDMTRDFQGPKIPPQQVTDAVLDAIRDGPDDIYVGEMACGIRDGLAADPHAVERELAQYLPPARPA